MSTESVAVTSGEGLAVGTLGAAGSVLSAAWTVV